MKKGLTYIGERTSQLRYSDNAEDVKWLQPLSEYIPLCEIKRGQAVSIATPEDIKEAFSETVATAILNTTDTYITLTNTSRHTHSIGLAQEYSAGITVDGDAITYPDKIHIIGHGEMAYDPDYVIQSQMAESTEDISKTEYYPDFFKDYSDNVGKTVYVKGVTSDSTDKGLLTINKEEAYLAYNNVIVVGHITNAYNSTSTDTTDKRGSIEVNIEGDDRGPIDNTQIEAVIGESFIAPKQRPVKVFALGHEDDSTFKFQLNYVPTDTKAFPTGFIALQRMDGKTYVLYTGTKDDTSSYSTEDLAFLNVAKFYTSDLITETFSIAKMSVDSMTGDFATLAESLSKGMAQIAYTEDNGIVSLKDGSTVKSISGLACTTTSSATAVVGTFTADQIGGFYEVYVSSNLSSTFPTTYTYSHGSYYNKGYAVLADIRNAERQNILGVYFSGNYDTVIAKKTNAIFLKQGLFTAPVGTFTVGESYYLGCHGSIFTVPQEYYNSIVKVGTAQSATKLIVDLNDPRRYNNGDLPVGYMKPTVNGEPEFGFFAMDGKTVHKVADFTLFYQRCLNWWNATELQYGTYTDSDGTPFVGFILPKVQYASHVDSSNTNDYVTAEIKYLAEGVYKELPRIPFIRKTTAFTNADAVTDTSVYRTTLPQIDITSLMIYGPEEDRIQQPLLEDLNIKLFVDLDWNDSGSSQSEHHWTQIDQGFHVWNNMQYYGFKWQIVKVQDASTSLPYGQWALEAVINGGEETDANNGTSLDEGLGGMGICYQSTPFSPPEQLYNMPAKIFVARNEYWSRQFDVESLFKDYVKENLEDLSGDPWVSAAVSGQAVRNDIAKKTYTENLVVGGEKAATPSNTGTVEAYIKSAVIKSDKASSEKTSGFPINATVDFRLSDPSASNSFFLDYIGGLLKYSDTDSTSSANSATLESAVTSVSNGYALLPYFMHKAHVNNVVTNGNTSISIPVTAPHGILNTGYTGNINAFALQGMHPGIPGSTFAANQGVSGTLSTFTTDLQQILPYMKYENKQYTTTLGATVENSVINSASTATSVLRKETVGKTGDVDTFFNTTAGVHTHTLYDTSASGTDNIKSFKIVTNFSTQTDGYDIEVYKATLDGTTSPASIYVSNITAASSIKYKTLIKEYFTGNVGTLEGGLDTSAASEALQAIYELPLAEFKYKSEPDWYKKYFGIITERVAATKAKFTTEASSLDDGVNSSITEKVDSATSTSQSYSYTKEELNAIADYLNKITDNSDKAQNILSSVGILFEAAKETQQRLLSLEVSTFGTDSPTLPGKIADLNDNLTDKNLTRVNTTLGLNRLIKALCKEIFLDYDPAKDAELNNSGTTVNLSRIDKLDDEINGNDNGTGDATSDDHVIDESKGTSYPDTVTETTEEAAYTIADAAVSDGANFDTYNKYLSAKVKTDALTTAESAGIVTKKFDGLNDAVNRIVVKLNRLTTNVNGQDNINARPQRLDTIRDNIETILSEIYYDNGNAYNDKEGTESAPFIKGGLSRLDELAEKLYSYSISLNGEINNSESGAISSNSANDYKAIDNETRKASLRTYNGKSIRGDLTSDSTETTGNNVSKITSVTPDSISDYSYATLLDIIVDLLGKTESGIIRGNGTIKSVSSITSDANAASFRLQETVLERLAEIEATLDLLEKRIAAKTYFENDAHTGTGYSGITSIDDFMDLVSGYLGITGGKKDTWKVTDLEATTAENNLQTATTATHTHAIMYDLMTRLRREEWFSNKLINYFGTDYWFNKPTLDKKAADNTSDADTYSEADPAYTITSDVSSMLKLLYGKDSGTKTVYSHFTTKSTETDNFSKSPDGVSILDWFFAELYKLPAREIGVTASASASFIPHTTPTDTNSNDTDHNALTYYNVDSEYSSRFIDGSKDPLADGNRADFTKGATLSSGQTQRKNRLDVIDDAIKAIRNFIGMDQMTTVGRFTGDWSFGATSDYTVNGKEFSLDPYSNRDSTSLCLMNFVMYPYNKIIAVDNRIGAYQLISDNKVASGTAAKYSTVAQLLDCVQTQISSNDTDIANLTPSTTADTIADLNSDFLLRTIANSTTADTQAARPVSKLVSISDMKSIMFELQNEAYTRGKNDAKYAMLCSYLTCYDIKVNSTGAIIQLYRNGYNNPTSDTDIVDDTGYGSRYYSVSSDTIDDASVSTAGYCGFYKVGSKVAFDGKDSYQIRFFDDVDNMMIELYVEIDSTMSSSQEAKAYSNYRYLQIYAELQNVTNGLRTSGTVGNYSISVSGNTSYSTQVSGTTANESITGTGTATNESAIATGTAANDSIATTGTTSESVTETGTAANKEITN